MSAADLTTLLQIAASGDPSAVKDFYTELLNSSVFIPLQAAQPLRFVDNDHTCIPAFFSDTSALLWAEGKYPVEKRAFRQLLQSIRENEWMLLNPGEELGKELSPWEISTLLQGPESIEELISELEFLPNVEVDVDHSTSLCPRFREQARSILDQYPPITEAFLIRVTTREPNETEKIMLGLKSTNLHPSKESAMLQELQDLAHNSSELLGGLTVITDLNQRTNPNVLLFDGATPFYMAPRQSDGPLARIRGWLSGKFGQKAD